ncbi:MAG: hypothetical protein ABSC21_03765, partial [Terriglobia bacterium]
MAETKPEDPKAVSEPPFTYWLCKRRLSILRKYQDLIRHGARLMPDLQYAQPLEKLIGPSIDLCIKNAMICHKKEGSSDCTMQPRNFSDEARMPSMERRMSP